DEVSSAGRAAVEIALLSCSANLFPARSARNVADARSKRFEDWIEMLDCIFGAADHHAVSAVNAPDAATGADIDVVDATAFQFQRPPNIVFVVRVAAVNDDVAGLEALSESINRLLGGIARRDHDPGCTRLFELADKIIERG